MGGQSNSTMRVGRVLALHTVNPILIPGTHMVPRSLLGVMSCVVPGVIP